MVSFLEIVLRDSDLRTGALSLPVNDVALPAGYQAKIDATVSACVDGTGDAPLVPVPENIYQTRVVRNQPVLNPTPPATGDIRDVWELLFTPTDPADGTKVMRLGLPGRTDNNGAYDSSSKGYLPNKNNEAWTALVDALSAAGVNVISNYPPNQPSDLIGARAVVSRRRTTALAGGVYAAQGTPISYLDLLTRDTNRLEGVARIPVTEVALPAGYQAKIDAITDALTAQAAGTPLIQDANMIWYTRVVSYQTVLQTDTPSFGKKSDRWIMQGFPAQSIDPMNFFTWSLPCRNTAAALTTAESDGKTIDLNNIHFQDLQTALSNLGVGMVVPYNTAIYGNLVSAFAKMASRKAPTL